MKLIYVAGKYTADSYSAIDDNIKKAAALSIQLFQKGWNVFTPHKNTAHYEIYEGITDLNYRTWINTTLDILKRCDAIIMLDGWEDSKGSVNERAFALDNGIAVYYQEDSIPTPKI